MSWKHPLYQYEVARRIEFVVQCTAFVHNVVLLIYHICSTYHDALSTQNNASNRDKTLKTSHRIHQLTFFTMLMLSIQRIPYILLVLHMKPRSISCEHWYWLQIISFFCTKTAVHLLFIERLYAIFYRSAFEFRVSTIYLTRIYLIFYFIFEASLTSIFNDHSFYNGVCRARHPMWVTAIVAIYDFCTGIFLSIVFTRKLLWFSTFALDALGMAHQQNLNSNTRSDLEQDIEDKAANVDVHDDVSDVMQLLKKVTLLALIAIFTTLAVFVFGPQSIQ
eukprot:407998_1